MLDAQDRSALESAKTRLDVARRSLAEAAAFLDTVNEGEVLAEPCRALGLEAELLALDVHLSLDGGAVVRGEGA